MKHIYISPHADDVALSCGGQIIANPARHSDTMVLTVFTSEARAAGQELRQIAKPFSDSVNSFRNVEDRLAWQSLGVSADYMNYPEALLRNRFPFAILPFGKDDKIIDQLCAAIGSFIALYPDARFYFPAGFGNHVDHLACTKAAFRLLDEGILDKISLYEDIPYCWLRFVRKPYYKVLLRNMALDKASLGQAFRPSGLAILAYLKRKIVPFPRGRKLFVAVCGSLFVERLRHKISGKKRLYEGTISMIGLTNDQTARKKDLLFRYKSQVPMLFGAHPNRLLNRCYKSFATEVLIKISRRPPDSAT